MTYHLEIYHSATELNDHYRWVNRAVAVFVAGLCGGAVLGLIGASLEASLWSASGVIALIMAACVASRDLRALYRNLLLLFATCLFCIGLGIGTWLAV